MEPEYFSYVEQDPSLHELLAPALPALRTLTAEQVETLVFYLKSLHSYYPASANESENWLGFSERLRVIRESPQQTTLQRKASSKLLKGMATCVVAGVFLTLGIALLAGGLTLGGGALIACLADGLTKDVVESLSTGIVAWWKELAPAVEARVVFKDSGFADDIAKTNMAAILNQNGILDVRSL